MKYCILFAALCTLATFPGVVLAQGSPSTAAPESVAVTTAAKAFYTSLQTGSIDRSHLSGDLNSALTDDLLKTLSRQLTALGTPVWTFLRLKQTPNGSISQYRLNYTSGATIYYSFGATEKGTVFAAFLGNADQ